MPEDSQKDLLKKTQTTLKEDGKVNFDSTYHKKKKQRVSGQTAIPTTDFVTIKG
jgi:ABC-2 type transport system permease protein